MLVRVVITNFRIIFEPHADGTYSTWSKNENEAQYFLSWFEKQPNFVKAYFNVPLGQVLRMKSKGSYINIATRDDREFRVCTIKGTPKGETKRISKTIENNCFFKMEFDHLKNSFPYKYKLDNPEQHNGWNMGDVVSELQRQNEDMSNSKLFLVVRNSDFNISPTYPHLMVVPKNMNEQEVVSCSQFRTKARIPALSYYYKTNGCSVWRSSQPKSGFFANNTEDQKMIHEIGAVNGVYKTLSIYDCRPQLNANANRFKGGGYESTDSYRNSDFQFCGIDNIHAVSKAFQIVQEIQHNPEALASYETFVKIIHESGYL